MSSQHDATSQDIGATRPIDKLSPGRGLLTLSGAVVVVGSFVALTHALAISDVWVGFLFALYWGGIERSNFKRLPHCAVGAATGLTVAYALHALPLALGNIAWVPCFAIILFMVYFQIMRWFEMVLNMVTMLFLTVATIPVIQTSTQYPQLMTSLAIGILYFVCVIWIAGQLARRGERNGAVQQEAQS